MKKFTIVFSLLFTAVFAGLVIFVSASEDFAPPKTIPTQEGIAEDSPVWAMSVDDLVAYLTEKGLINPAKKQLVSEVGFTSYAVNYEGIEIYWWDLENLDKDSDEYAAYLSLAEEGFIDLWGSGNIISPTLNGPFALQLVSDYAGDADLVTKAFKQFGKEQ